MADSFDQIAKFLSVKDPSETLAVEFRLGVTSGGDVSLWSSSGNTPLTQWTFALDKARFEQQFDGPSIRIGMKRFVINDRHSQSEIDDWMRAAENSGTGTDDIASQDATSAAELAEKMIRFKDMLDKGMISQDEFDSLVMGAVGTASPTNQRDDSMAAQLNELREANNYRDFVAIWRELTDINPPPTIDEKAATLVVQGEVNRYLGWRQKPHQFLELAALGQDITRAPIKSLRTMMALNQLAKETEKAVRKGRRLPDETERILHDCYMETKRSIAPMVAFAQRMGWQELGKFSSF